MVRVLTAFVASTTIVVEAIRGGPRGDAIIDASIVARVLVPAFMNGAGQQQRVASGWLDRILPHLGAEGTE